MAVGRTVGARLGALQRRAAVAASTELVPRFRGRTCMNTVPATARIARPRTAVLLASLAFVLGGCVTTEGSSLDRAVRCEAGEFAACDHARSERYRPYGQPYDLWDAYGGMSEFELWYGTPYPYGIGRYPYGAAPYPYGVAPYPNDGYRGDWRHRNPYRGVPPDRRDPRIDRGPDPSPTPDDRRWRGRPPSPGEPGRWAPQPAPMTTPGAPPRIDPPPRGRAPSEPPQFTPPPVAAPPAAPRERAPAPPPAMRREPEMRTQQQ